MEKTSEKSRQPQFPVYDLHVFYVRGTDRDDTDHGCFAEPLWENTGAAGIVGQSETDRAGGD